MSFLKVLIPIRFWFVLWLLLVPCQLMAVNQPFSLKTNPFLYSSEYTDNESRLQYLSARYYNPRIDRFISWDSLRLMNRYNYADGNPIMNIDPSGHSSDRAVYNLYTLFISYWLISPADRLIFHYRTYSYGILLGAQAMTAAASGLLYFDTYASTGKDDDQKTESKSIRLRLISLMFGLMATSTFQSASPCLVRTTIGFNGIGFTGLMATGWNLSDESFDNPSGKKTDSTAAYLLGMDGFVIGLTLQTVLAWKNAANVEWAIN